MKRRVAAGIMVAWLAALAILLQPHSHPAPRVLHAHLLDPPDRNLPTLGPGGGR